MPIDKIIQLLKKHKNTLLYIIIGVIVVMSTIKISNHLSNKQTEKYKNEINILNEKLIHSSYKQKAYMDSILFYRNKTNSLLSTIDTLEARADYLDNQSNILLSEKAEAKKEIDELIKQLVKVQSPTNNDDIVSHLKNKNYL